MFKLPSFKKSDIKTSKFLTLEINSCEVKCLALYKEASSLKIIGSGSVSVESGFIRNGIIVDMETVVGYVKEAVEKATSEIEEDITDVILGISSDMCQELVTTAKITRGDGTPITQNELENFQQKIVDSASSQIHSQYSELTGDVETELEVITSSVVYTKVDNQKMDEVVGRNAQILEIALYTAFSPSFHIQSLKKLTKKAGLNLLAISSEAFSLVKALKNTSLENTDLVLMQINGDFTNVSVVFGGAVVKCKSLHIGKKHFVEEIARIMGITIPEATKVLDSHAKGALTQSESVVVQNCLGDALELWLEGVIILFSDFIGVKTFAPHLYLFGNATQIPDIEELLNESPWTKSIPFQAPPTVKTLDMIDLTKITDGTGRTSEKKWVGPASLAYIYEEIA